MSKLLVLCTRGWSMSVGDVETRAGPSRLELLLSRGRSMSVGVLRTRAGPSHLELLLTRGRSTLVGVVENTWPVPSRCLAMQRPVHLWQVVLLWLGMEDPNLVLLSPSCKIVRDIDSTGSSSVFVLG